MRLITTPIRRRSERRDACRHRRRGPQIAPVSAPPARPRIGACTPRPHNNRLATAPRSDRIERRRRVTRRLVLIGEAVALVLLVSGSAAHAEVVHGLADAAGLDQVKTILDNVRNWVMGILGSIATVFLSVGFVRRIVGASDPEEQSKAKAAFKAAGIGYAGAALTPLIVTILQGIVGS